MHLNLENRDRIKKNSDPKGTGAIQYIHLTMLSQNNGNKPLNLEHVTDCPQALGLSTQSDSILEFARNYGAMLADFGIKAIAEKMRSQPSQDSPNDARSILMAKAKEYDKRCHPINVNPPLERKSNEELLNFILTCAKSEMKKNQFS